MAHLHSAANACSLYLDGREIRVDVCVASSDHLVNVAGGH